MDPSERPEPQDPEDMQASEPPPAVDAVGGRLPPLHAGLAAAAATLDRGDHAAARALLDAVDRGGLDAPDLHDRDLLSRQLGFDPAFWVVGAGMSAVWGYLAVTLL
jgi:hypothetical protein